MLLPGCLGTHCEHAETGAESAARLVSDETGHLRVSDMLSTSSPSCGHLCKVSVLQRVRRATSDHITIAFCQKVFRVYANIKRVTLPLKVLNPIDFGPGGLSGIDLT